MKKLIVEALKPLGVPVAYVQRESDGTFPFIVFNVDNRPAWICDDEEEGYEYLITVNIFAKGNFDELQKEVIRAMKEAGIRFEMAAKTEWMSEESVYNQAMGFSYFKYH